MTYVLAAATDLWLWTRHVAFGDALPLFLRTHLGPFVLGVPPGARVLLCVLCAVAALTFVWHRTTLGAAISALGTITWLAAGTSLLAAISTV